MPKLDLSGYFAALKKHWMLFLLTIVVVVVFFSTAIIGVYNKLRAKVPVLPAAK